MIRFGWRSFRIPIVNKSIFASQRFSFNEIIIFQLPKPMSIYIYTPKTSLNCCTFPTRNHHYISRIPKPLFFKDCNWLQSLILPLRFSIINIKYKFIVILRVFKTHIHVQTNYWVLHVLLYFILYYIILEYLFYFRVKYVFDPSSFNEFWN